VQGTVGQQRRRALSVYPKRIVYTVAVLGTFSYRANLTAGEHVIDHLVHDAERVEAYDAAQRTAQQQHMASQHHSKH
jgi:hypothetical protein